VVYYPPDDARGWQLARGVFVFLVALAVCALLSIDDVDTRPSLDDVAGDDR
jgi:hypothetical protein